MRWLKGWTTPLIVEVLSTICKLVLVKLHHSPELNAAAPDVLLQLIRRHTAVFL
jgi:hypothetical protein